MAKQANKVLVGHWLKWTAVLTVLLLPTSVMGYRLKLYDFSIASKVLLVSLLLAAIVFLVASLLNITQRSLHPKNSELAGHAWCLSLIPLLLLGSQIIIAKSRPMIHNISTDVIDPPKFSKIVQLRGSEANPHHYDKAVLASIQLEAYPHIDTLLVNDSVDVAFRKANAAVSLLGWTLVGKDSTKGVIEATETSGIWKFKDDVVIRIGSGEGQTKVDVRSVSRVGRSDLGANAKRINKFFDTYRAL